MGSEANAASPATDRRPVVGRGEVGRGAVTFDERAAGAVAGLAAGVVFPGRRGSGEVGRPRA